mmetsp:Transcript_34088/g.38794  ORF Transcript_34088/g.38794 Transcript_34088/m.38794 type:complete len:512 (-) Transcript_34088:77-1612(-)|eukprot:CAMPEP_0194150658 /NCGR_PEP_ID=MMETSP0152-20130528/44487_1 /TAXON_ID=1049557 /ORGANISM="Thalassiothrix antarctica, Strain L6-D1" /LENGTH=511 /DNA_ID=CAMNT_0038853793 /DNA_START=102 /DNA_END=1637 /DNA_ORIENTATION=-
MWIVGKLKEMLNFGKERKLQGERERQSNLIAQQLKSMELDHELEYEKLTQRGFIANQEQKIAKEKREELLKKKKTAKKATKPSSSVEVEDENSSYEDFKKEPTSKEEMSYVEMARQGYQQLINAIIRPPRAQYEMKQLGPPEFNFAGKTFERIDWTLMTARGYAIQVSQWGLKQGDDEDDSSTNRPIVIYLHGNSSARVEILPQLTSLLSMGLIAVSLDFAGSGKSDGEYVSLGYFEREDLATVVTHLRRHHGRNKNLKIALWGRSMGAATAIMYGARDSRIDCMICDSSFASIVQLAEELVEMARQHGKVVPTVVVGTALKMIQWSVEKHAKFNIRDLSPIKYAADCETIPALFIHGEGDNFIKQHHSYDICVEYKGPKSLLVVKGDHNDQRSLKCILTCQSFLKRHLIVSDDWDLLRNGTINNPMYPPWFQKSLDASTGFDNKMMGMSQERQEEIRFNINKVLGQELSDDYRAEENDAVEVGFLEMEDAPSSESDSDSPPSSLSLDGSD